MQNYYGVQGTIKTIGGKSVKDCNHKFESVNSQEHQYSLPLPSNLYQMDSKQLFEELSRIDNLLVRLQDCCLKLLASSKPADTLLAAQIKTYSIKQESYRVRIQQRILATRK